VIGPRGQEVENLKIELEKLTGRKINVNVVEIKRPELDAQLVAESIAEQLCKRASFRRAMKQHCEAAMNAGAKGVKIICGGRLGGSELARRETQKQGSIPLHTLEADVDYAIATARTTYGAIGIKVWIYKGRFNEEQTAGAPPMPARKTAPKSKPAPVSKPESGTDTIGHAAEESKNKDKG
jgi:small subunit ribosomal protein S3